MRSVGLFGGSFNPIHNAHVELAERIREQVGLDEIWFIISPHNPLKQAEGLVDEQHRFAMARLALEDNPHLIASDYEFHLTRPSFTWNTLQHLHHDFPDTQFHLLIGADNWDCFDRWAHHDDILRNYKIIVYPREGYPLDKAHDQENPCFVDTPLINMSSTMIREAISAGKDVSDFISPKVEDYIRKNGIY